MTLIQRPCFYSPDPDLEDSGEEGGDGGDELADVDDEFLLQHGLRHVVREALAVQDLLDLVRRQGFVYHFLLLAEHSYCHLQKIMKQVKQRFCAL